jgi:F1F0 ATPase subunit 2
MNAAIQVQLPTLFWSAATGIVLGILFFCGVLWNITKTKSTKSTIPTVNEALWRISSLTSRVCMVAAGFYLVADNDWGQLLACLGGFLIGNLLLRPFKHAATTPPLRLHPNQHVVSRIHS